MSGYNKEKGVFYLNEKMMSGYLRNPIDIGIDLNDVRLFKYCAKLLEHYGIQVLQHTPYGIEAVADDAQIWEALSGEPAKFGFASPSAKDVYAKWLEDRIWFNATDLGKEISPNLSAVKVNKILESIGFQARIEGAWKPTKIAKGYFKMKAGSQLYKSENIETPMWKRTVIDLLRFF